MSEDLEALRPTERFSNRVSDYLKYRPHYPLQLMALLRREMGLEPGWAIADVGSGTGFLAERFLENGNRVFGVEPNRAMREAGEEYLRRYGPRFVSVDGRAEATAVASASVDLVSVGQALHWFDVAVCGPEFRRILRGQGAVVLVWNARDEESSEFMREYGAHMRGCSQGDRHEKVRGEAGDGARIAQLYGAGGYRTAVLANHQLLDKDGLRGRAASASYAPAPGEAAHAAFVAALDDIYDRHQRDGVVRFAYRTEVFWGWLAR